MQGLVSSIYIIPNRLTVGYVNEVDLINLKYSLWFSSSLWNSTWNVYFCVFGDSLEWCIYLLVKIGLFIMSTLISFNSLYWEQRLMDSSLVALIIINFIDHFVSIQLKNWPFTGLYNPCSQRICLVYCFVFAQHFIPRNSTNLTAHICDFQMTWLHKEHYHVRNCFNLINSLISFS
jgi:hypothetical protein